MKNIHLIIFSVFFLINSSFLYADEGMWIPLFLEKYNIADMQKKGFKLTAEDIYSVNHASMKDAVVLFGRGCTGELVSDQGLLITNHHCGYGTIQSHSTVENDLLTSGFWAMSKEEELVSPGLTVTFLVRMEDVTQKVLVGIDESMTEEQRAKIVKENCDKIEKEAVAGTHYNAVIKPFYYGNEYYLYVNETFKDVRLVGAPPSAIGKFGGDTDNWMWPRHTGDFSMFRIYADKDNNPAEYSPDNVPYKPKKFFSISLKGVQKDDFTMVFGYPGTTTEYLASYAVKMTTEDENPYSINLRDIRLKIMKNGMDKSDKVRIQYASKYAGVANYWKKWIGENRGLKKLNAIEVKQQLETKFKEWTTTNPELKNKYGALLPKFEELYTKLTPYNKANTFMFEAIMSIELISFTNRFNALLKPENQTDENFKKTIESLKSYAKGYFKNYNTGIDRNVAQAMLKEYFSTVENRFFPSEYNLIEKKFKGNYENYCEYIYSKSIFADETKVYTFLENLTPAGIKKLFKDPGFILTNSFLNMYKDQILPDFSLLNDEIEKLMRTYITGLRSMQADKIFYPDANLTLRVAYGNVNDYYPRDGVYYNYYTTLDGIIQKESPDISDYKVPEKLKKLYEAKDYGNYAVNGKLPVCFIASNHTTGGNSGSPVLDANGRLIGVNFDRDWEGTMSDIMYDPDQCRNIVLDIRYLLFIVDKFAGAQNLIKEMTLEL